MPAPAAAGTTETMPPDTAEADIELRLEPGSSSAQGHFAVPDPRTHVQTIEVTIDPAESPVVIDFTTTTGSTLHVLGPGRDNCSPDDDRIKCHARFPILEAQGSGRWTVTASKPDGRATAVTVRVGWETVETSD
jgi:hypothetical protein